MSKYVVRMCRKDTNESLYARTSNLKSTKKHFGQQLNRAINGQFVSDRFKCFNGSNKNDVVLEVYGPMSSIITGHRVATDPKFN